MRGCKGNKRTRRKGGTATELKRAKTKNPYRIKKSETLKRTITYNPKRIKKLPRTKAVIPYIKEEKKPKGGKTLIIKDVNNALNTGVGVAEDMGHLGMKVGKTAIKEVEGVGSEGIKLSKKSMKFGKKMLSKKNKKSKGKKGKNSYRTFLSKRLKEVKRKHPSWPQSKIFKEAVKGWKSK